MRTRPLQWDPFINTTCGLRVSSPQPGQALVDKHWNRKVYHPDPLLQPRRLVEEMLAILKQYH